MSLLRHVSIIRVTDDQAEFIAHKARVWVEIMADATGYQVRVYRSPAVHEGHATDAVEAISVARELVRHG